MIQNRINAPQKGPAEGREAVSKKIVQCVALVDASNFHAPAFVCMHMFLFEFLAELLFELLLEPFEIVFESGYALLQGRARDGDRLIILDLHSPAE